MPKSALTNTARIVAAYLAANKYPRADIPALIRNVHAALTRAPDPSDASIAQTPPAPTPKQIAASITHDFLISFENGKRFRTLRRHLRVQGMTPKDYRAKWGLPDSYPMTAPGYSAIRSQLAKKAGLGSPRNKT